MTTTTMDQRARISSSMFIRKNELSELVDNYITKYGITRDTGLTLFTQNFFCMYDEINIRNKKGFKEYFYGIDYEYQVSLINLFRLMKQDVFLEYTVEKEVDAITVFLHREPWEEPEFFELFYNDSLVTLLHQYTTRQINIKTTVEDLLLRIMELENEKS